MFLPKSKLAKIAMGSVLTSFLTFTTFMPVSAADIKATAESNAVVYSQEQSPGDFLCPYLSDLPEKGKIEIELPGIKYEWKDGKLEIIELDEESAPVDGEKTAPVDEEESAPVDDEETAPVDEEESAPVDD